MSADHIGEATNMVAPVEALSSKPVDDTGEANSSVKPTVEAVAWMDIDHDWDVISAHHKTKWASGAYGLKNLGRYSRPLYTHPPQPDALPGDLRERVACPTCRGAHPELCSDVFHISHPAPIKPSGDTGELRERVNGLLARYFPEILMDQNGNACGVSFVVREQRVALTDAILDLIQSDRGSPISQNDQPGLAFSDAGQL